MTDHILSARVHCFHIIGYILHTSSYQFEQCNKWMMFNIILEGVKHSVAGCCEEVVIVAVIVVVVVVVWCHVVCLCPAGCV